ncbi:porin family protein [Shewanella youngdeokensis]|uniref:Porin family protein n=1 Tax=Shewanella youngdeokensis TaxID=2999068 RepID=A0ABZ0JXP4_9GAMM|nr:porin family protein [Shewanella sp. DAU334]
MNKLSIIAIAVLGLTTANIATAETNPVGVYVGGQLGAFSVDLEGDSESGQSYGLYGGYNFNEWFSLEVNLYTTNDFLKEDGIDVSAAAFSVEPKFTWVIDDTFSIYGKAGVASAGIYAESSLGDIDFTGAGFTIGAGINAAITEKLTVRLAYDLNPVTLEHDDSGVSLDVDLSNLTLGLQYQF